ncbi:MAG: hypothetical protein AB7I38_14775 [Dehalococcoidia bacterium]
MDADEPGSEAPSERLIGAFLDDYERELAFREASTDEFSPVAAELRRCLERWAAGEAATGDTRTAYERYAITLRRWQDDLERWVSIRGSGERLLPMAEFMSDEQWERFSALQARDVGTMTTDGALDRDQAVIRQILPRFEGGAGLG